MPFLPFDAHATEDSALRFASLHVVSGSRVRRGRSLAGANFDMPLPSWAAVSSLTELSKSAVLNLGVITPLGIPHQILCMSGIYTDS